MHRASECQLRGLTHPSGYVTFEGFAVAAPSERKIKNGGLITHQTPGHPANPTQDHTRSTEKMQFINIAGAATLTGIGLGSLAGGALLWRRAGFDLASLARLLEALRTP